LKPFLPYGRQSIDQSDIAAVAAALSEPLITQGPRVAAFEEAFAEAVSAQHAVAFSSGTAALHAAADAAGLGPGDEVLTTPISFVASANCALFVGARPVFADIDPVTANLDLTDAAHRGLLDRASACVIVSMAGLPADLSPLREARRAGMIIIEDGCHALGAIRDGRPVGGSDADMTAFSLHPVKAITSGEGGMVTTDDAIFAERLRAFRTHGIRRPAPSDDVMHGGWHYEVESLGFNYRITDIQCALGSSQLKRLNEFIAARNEIADLYQQALRGIPDLVLPARAPAGWRHGYHLFVVRFPEGAARRRIVYEALLAEGIGTQLHYIPIPAHALYRELGYDLAALPEAVAYWEQALSLPIFPGMDRSDVARVAGALERVLSQPVAHS
jgi:perosamine synthetase